MESSRENKFRALVRLADETDSDIYSLIREQIIASGVEIIPLLKEALAETFQDDMIERLSDLISTIHLQHIKNELKIWLSMGAPSLLNGAILISQFRYSELQSDEIKKEIDNIRQDIWLELNDKLTFLEKIRVVNHVFYEIYGFKPNKNDFHNPSNSYISDVLQKKTGSPISLSVIYIILCQNLGIPVVGINLPEHFICALINEGESGIGFIPKGEPLFYINPFNYGAVFTKAEVEDFLKKIRQPVLPDFLSPCSNASIVLRLLNNLSFSYKNLQLMRKHQEIEELKKLFEGIS